MVTECMRASEISRMAEFDWRHGQGGYCGIEVMCINYAHTA